jgi:putative membrane protein
MNSLLRSAAMAAMLAGLMLPAAFAADPSTKTSAPSTLSHDDKEFFQKAAQTGLLEVQAAGIAATRALAPKTKAFAATMAADHGAANDSLKMLAASKGVTLPTQLDRDHREVLERLQKEEPDEFDETYAEAMRHGHKEAIELFKEAVEDSKDVDIRAFANSTLPTLRHHLDMAKDLTRKS